MNNDKENGMKKISKSILTADGSALLITTNAAAQRMKKPTLKTLYSGGNSTYCRNKW